MLKRAVDIGGVEMVIQEKAKKEEEKVNVVKEKPVAPQVNRTTTNIGISIREAFQKFVNGFIILFFDGRQKLQ